MSWKVRPRWGSEWLRVILVWIKFWYLERKPIFTGNQIFWSDDIQESSFQIKSKSVYKMKRVLKIWTKAKKNYCIYNRRKHVYLSNWLNVLHENWQTRISFTKTQSKRNHTSIIILTIIMIIVIAIIIIIRLDLE